MALQTVPSAPVPPLLPAPALLPACFPGLHLPPALCGPTRCGPGVSTLSLYQVRVSALMRSVTNNFLLIKSWSLWVIFFLNFTF